MIQVFGNADREDEAEVRGGVREQSVCSLFFFF